MCAKKLDVAIIDYKMSNMFSIQSACDHVGLVSEITNDREKILNASSAILPGVGAFGPAMDQLIKFNLVKTIKEFIDLGKPFMGICLGMQLLFSQSEEFGRAKGLDIIKGSIKKFPLKDTLNKKNKIPQIGWNKINVVDSNRNNMWYKPPLNNIQDGNYMYFVHSFYAIPFNEDYILTTTNYAGINYCSSIVYNNIFACQFHPEKSAKEGLKIYKNFAMTINNGKNNNE